MTYYVEWPCTHKDGSKWTIGFPLCKTLKDVGFVAARKLEIWGEKWAAEGKTLNPYITVCKAKRHGAPELVGFYELVGDKLKKAGNVKLTDYVVI